MKKLTVLLLFLCATVTLPAQSLTVTPVSPDDGSPFSIINLATQLLPGNDVQIQNVGHTGPLEAIGLFTGGMAGIGIDSGLVISTGQALSAALPNDEGDTGFSFGAIGFDDLSMIAGAPTVDATTLIIQFIPQTDTFSLQYVFASEEYHEWNCSNFNDPIGIFLSGPGISGPFFNGGINLGTVPGKPDVPVSINTINNGDFSQNGPAGCSLIDPDWLSNVIFFSGDHPEVTYDGFTQVLPARPTAVVPGSSYMLIIAIADKSDGNYDSALFLAARSLGNTGNPNNNISYQDVSLCAGDSLFFGGQWLTQSGSYIDTLTATDGSDSAFVFLQLDVADEIFSVIDFSTCYGDTIFLADTFYVASTQFTEVFPAAGGCDSILYYNVLIEPDPNLFQFTYEDSLCFGDTLHLAYWEIPPIEEDNLTGFSDPGTDGIPDNPADSLVRSLTVSGFGPDATIGDPIRLARLTLNLEHSRVGDLEIRLVCPGGQEYLVELAYGPSIPCIAGQPVLGDSLSPTPGTGYPFRWAGELYQGGLGYYLSGFSPDTLRTDVYYRFIQSTFLLSDCPIDGEWQLIIQDQHPGENGFLFDWSLEFYQTPPVQPLEPINQQWITGDNTIQNNPLLSLVRPEPGDHQYSYELTAGNGCPFEASFPVNVADAPSSERDTIVCAGDFVFPGQIATGDGVFYQQIPTGDDCDSIVVHNVTVIEPVYEYVLLYTCNPDSVYTDTLYLTAVSGCDSIVTIDRVFQSIDYLVEVTAAVCDTETGSATVTFILPGNYQVTWFDGSTGPFIDGLAPGIYTGEITEAGQNCVEPFTVEILPDSGPAEAAFTLQVNGRSVTTLNFSSNADTFAWDFGDGFVSTEMDLTYEYPSCGTYEVCLTAANECDTDTTCQTIDVSEVILGPVIYLYPCVGDTAFVADTFFLATTLFADTLMTANSCDSVARYDLEFIELDVQLSPDVDTTVCLGDTVQLELNTDFFVLANGLPLSSTPDLIPIPDGNGATLQLLIDVSAFAPGATLDDPDLLATICVEIEHSWLRDLEIALVCPDGNSIILHDFFGTVGGEVRLGEPVDPDDGGPIPGVGYQYCWTAGSTNGTWLEYANANMPLTLPPQDYAPFQPFSDLAGCPLNGEWRLQITDLWGLDNGFVFDWSITLDGQTFPYSAGGLESASGTWLDGSTVLSGTEESLIALPQAGVNTYTYALQYDNGGCSVEEAFAFNGSVPFTAAVDTILCLGADFFGQTINEPETVAISFPAQDFCDSLITYQIDVVEPDTFYTEEVVCQNEDVGTSTEVFPGVSGCDSLVITERIFAPDTVFQSVFDCDFTITDTLYNLVDHPDGCDTLIALEIIGTPPVYDVLVAPDSCSQGVGSITINMISPPGDFQYVWAFFPDETGNTLSDLEAGNYNVTVSLSDGNCGFELDIPVPSTLDPPQADFFFGVEGNTVTFTNTSAPAESYTWTFGDGDNSTEANPVHVYEETGVYEICLTATNSCGADQYCEVVDLDMPVYTLIAGDAAGGYGDILSVPVTIGGGQRLASISGEFAVVGPPAFTSLVDMTPVGFSTGQFDFQLVGATFVFSWSAPGEPGLDFNPGDTLMMVDIQMQGLPGQSGAAQLTALEAARYDVLGNLQVSPINGEDGLIIHDGNEGNVLGTVLVGPPSQAVTTPMENVELRGAFPTGVDTSYTDFQGEYFLAEVPYLETITVTAHKDGDDLNGLSTASIVRIQQHLAGVEPFTTPYELIAADANCDEQVDGDDTGELQLLLMGDQTGLSNCPSWVFLPLDTNFPDPLQPFPFPQSIDVQATLVPSGIANFQGIKKGDVLGEADPNGLLPPLTDTLFFLVNNRTAQTGDTIELMFAVSQFNELLGYQFGLQFDAGALAFLDATPMNLNGLTPFNFGLSMSGAGQLRTNWVTPTGLPASAADNTAAFRLRFEAQATINDLASLFQLDDGLLRAEAYDATLQRQPLRLLFDGVNATEGAPLAGFRLLSNQPNPFTGQTVIPFELPRAMRAEVVVRDLLGREVERFDRFFSSGRNEIVFTSEASLAAGIYSYELVAGEFRAVRKMVLNR